LIFKNSHNPSPRTSITNGFIENVTYEEVAETRAYMEKVVNGNMGARQTADIVSDIISN